MSNHPCEMPFCRRRGPSGETSLETARGARPCAACRDAVRGDLLRLPGLYEECAEALVPGHRPPVERIGGRRGGRPHRGVDLDDRVVSVRSKVLGVLASWSALVADERRRPAPRDGRVPSLVGFLDEHLDWLLEHPAGADFVRETAGLDAAMRSVLDPAPERSREVGRCAAPGCDRVVRVGRRSETSCDAGHTWQARPWLLLAGPERSGTPGSAGKGAA